MGIAQRYVSLLLASLWAIFLVVVFNVMLNKEKTRLHQTSPLYTDIRALKQENQPVVFRPTKQKILCWILTQPKNLNSRAQAVKSTWGSRCDKTLFFSSVDNETFPAIGLSSPEGRAHLPNKTIKALTYCYQHYGDEFEWFLKADDDTYVIVENLRKFVSNLSSSDPLYFGHNFYKYFKQGYMSGGAGYVLSREALKRFVTEVAKPDTICKLRNVANEDVLVGSCLERLNVRALDTVDDQQRERFLPLDPTNYLLTGFPWWLPDFTKFKPKMGKECCARDIISFHYVKPPMMYLYDMLIYRVQLPH